MIQNTAAVITISEDILLGRKDVNSLGNLPVLLVPKWNITKFIILPAVSQLVQYEVKMAFKMCEIVIVIDETDNVDFSVCNTIASLFCEEMKIMSNEVSPFKLLNVCNAGESVSSVPVFSFQRIFLLKEHVPAFHVLKSYLNDYRTKLKYRKTFDISKNTNIKQSGFNALQTIGALFEVHEKEHKYVLSTEAPQLNSLIELQQKIIEKFGSENITHRKADLNIFESYYFQVDSCVCQAIKIIEECFKTYSPDNVFISFNGGKDCTVLLHLTLAVLQKNYSDAKNPPCLYVRSEFAFPEQDSFIQDCQSYYDIEVIFAETDIKEALQIILEKKPNLKACLMGTRRTDPYSATLNTFQMTDPDWPQVVRVSPLLDWHYSYIWDYLLYFKVPYCNLYNMGYTSLGNMKNTVKNPSLLSYDVLEDKDVYLPAYKLMDAKKERNGRSS